MHIAIKGFSPALYYTKHLWITLTCTKLKMNTVAASDFPLHKLLKFLERAPSKLSVLVLYQHPV